MSPDRDPTPDELLAMAYVDGELSDEARRAVDERLPRDPALAREVAALQRLDLLARRAAPPEPADHEWERLRRDPVQRVGGRLGVLLVGVGGVGLLGCVAGWLVVSDLPLAARAALGCVLAGLAVLLALAVRARVRVLPYDPYTAVER